MNLLSIATMNKIAIVALDVVKEAESESSILSPDQMAHYAVTAIFTIINVLVAYFILKLVLFKPKQYYPFSSVFIQIYISHCSLSCKIRCYLTYFNISVH